jgi:hypothetical protein
MWPAAWFPESALMNRAYAVWIVPGLPRYGLNLEQLCFKMARCWACVDMYSVQQRDREWTPIWVALQAFSVVCAPSCSSGVSRTS